MEAWASVVILTVIIEVFMKKTKFITVALMISTLLLSTSVFAKSAFDGIPSRDIPQAELEAVSGDGAITDFAMAKVRQGMMMGAGL